MPLISSFEPTREAALARIRAVRPGDYARSRNALEGAVTGLSPYITHGMVSLPEVLAAVNARHPLDVQHKFVFELGWREYFRHVWHFRGREILTSLREGPLPDASYDRLLPADIRQAATGVPVIDMAVRTLYNTGYLHNHARMWLASYVVHIRKVHWRIGADWLYGHLLDGDLASNHLSWQWVAGTGSSKPYLFNADNVARYAPPAWHSPGSVIDQSYEALDRIARQSARSSERSSDRSSDRPSERSLERSLERSSEFQGSAVSAAPDSGLAHANPQIEPPVSAIPPAEFGWTSPDAAVVEGREVWLVHPWNLGELPADLPSGTVVVGLLVSDFHRAWPWSEARWRFVCSRMTELATVRWVGNAAHIGEALKRARRVRSVDEPHLKPWLEHWAECEATPALFPAVDRRCDSFSQWWNRVSRDVELAAELLDTSPAGARQARLWHI